MPSFKGRRPTGTNKNTTRRGPAASANPRGSKKIDTTIKRTDKKLLPRKKILNPNAPTIENTGMESLYFKELVEKEVPVVVVCNDGETFRGIIRYYDRDVFSIGTSEGGPKMNIRKAGVRYIYEDQDKKEE